MIRAVQNPPFKGQKLLTSRFSLARTHYTSCKNPDSFRRRDWIRRWQLVTQPYRPSPPCPLYGLVLIKKKKKEKKMKIYGLSDARTHRIIPFPRSPFLEYQWGGARLRPGSSVSDLLDTRFVLKSEFSFIRDEGNRTNFFFLPHETNESRIETQTFHSTQNNFPSLRYRKWLHQNTSSPGTLSPHRWLRKTGEAAKVTPRRGRIWPPIYRKED